ncbi:reverse transcriptase domain-containing protein [Tanacetum coccineum]
MRTRSQSRNSNRQQQQVNLTFVEPFNLVEPIKNQAPPVVMMDDNRTMAQLLEAPTVGYEDVIVVLEITADNFELKHGLLTLVQNKQFFGYDKEDPHAHIRYFNKITSTMKFLNVPSTSVKLMLFPFSLKGAARIWLEKEPPRSILTSDDRVSKFINKFFSLSKTTNLRNEITRFQQRFDKTFYEAWDRLNDLLRACPHHGFSELHQLDTFYNALNSNDQDSLNSGPGGDLSGREALQSILSKVHSRVREERAVWGDDGDGDVGPRRWCGGDRLADALDIVGMVVDEIATKMEAWDRFNDLLRACPHHGFSELHQLDTFYNALNSNDQDSLNSAAGGNFLDKMPRDCLRIIESKSKVRNSRNKPVVAKVSASSSTPGISPDVAELKDMVKALLLDKKNQNQAPAPIKAVEESCVTCGGAHSYRNCPTTDGNVYRDNIQEYVSQEAAANFNQGNTSYRSPIANQIRPPGSGTLPSNTITNPKEDLKGITTRSDAAYQGPTIPTTSSSPLKVVERETEPVVAPVSAPMPNLKPSIPYPSRRNDEKCREKANDQVENEKANNQIEKFYEIFKDLNFDADPRVPLILGRSFLKTGRALIDVYEGELTLRVGKEAVTFNLDQTSRYSSNYDDMTANRIDAIEMVCEEYSQEVLGFSDVIASGNPTPYYDPIVSTSSPTFTPFGDSDFLLEEVDALLALEDDPTSPEVDDSYYDPEGDILFLKAFLNDDPSLPPPTQGNYFPEIQKELKVCEAKTNKSSIDEPPEVELKDLPPHLEYVFLEGNDKLPVIIAKDLSVEEKVALIKVLKSHKRAIAWKLSDIKGINPKFCTHKILMEEDYKPAIQHQRQVNPKIHDVFKKEVEKLLDTGLIYLISNSPWVSPVHCVPKKGGFTVVENDENELIPTRLVTR